MTDNEKKLLQVNRRYQLLKTMADFAPMVSAVLLVIVMSLQIGSYPAVLKILNSERGQDSARASMYEYRATRILTESRILQNQDTVIRNQKEIIKLLKDIKSKIPDTVTIKK